MGFPGSSADKEFTCTAGDPGSIPGFGRPLEKGQATHSSIFGFPGGSDGKESTCNVGDPGSMTRLGRSPGGEDDNPLQYSCLDKPMDRGAWRTTVHGVAKSRTGLSN